MHPAPVAEGRCRVSPPGMGGRVRWLWWRRWHVRLHGRIGRLAVCKGDCRVHVMDLQVDSRHRAEAAAGREYLPPEPRQSKTRGPMKAEPAWGAAKGKTRRCEPYSQHMQAPRQARASATRQVIWIRSRRPAVILIRAPAMGAEMQTRAVRTLPATLRQRCLLFQRLPRWR